MEPNVREHDKSFDFLEGNPLGYDKVFTDKEILENKENESKETLQNKESKDSPEEEVVEQSGENESQENDKKENDSINVDEETNYAKMDEEEHSHEEDSQPFERYSDRPYSPPENYEDEKYSDLGPRVNKPYFYHPPFEVPEYEKRKAEKNIDHPYDSDWNHSAETEDHETYIYPWEKEKEEEQDEEDYSSLGKYEYPWERRERKEKERRQKEKERKRKAELKRKHDELYGISEEDDDNGDTANTKPVYEDEDGRKIINTKPVYEDEDGIEIISTKPIYEDGDDGEATNTRPVYIPPNHHHTRGKKDVNKMEYSPRIFKNGPKSKLINKYQSGVVKIPFKDEDMSISAADNDEIKDSIIDYLTKEGSSKPRIKSQTSQKSILNDTYVISTSDDSPLHSKRRNNLTTKIIFNPQINPISSTDLSLSTNPTRDPTIRLQSRKNEIKSFNDSVNNKNIFTGSTTNRQTSSTSSPMIRTRNHVRRNSINTSTTSSPIRPSVKRRFRPTSKSITSSTSSVTSKAIHGNRKRSFKIHTEADKNTTRPQRKFITSSTVPTSTGKTIEHHSHVSKKEIITKTIYPDEDDDEEGNIETEENSSNQENVKLASQNRPVKSFRIKRRGSPKNDDEHTMKKQKVEKVTITMEETPNHVYRTKEIDKDGVKGKFVTFIANNNSTIQTVPNDNLHISDSEMEEIKKRFHTLDSTIQENVNLDNDSNSDDTMRNYLVGNLLQNSPLPAIQRSIIDSIDSNNTTNHNSRNSKEDDDNEEENEDTDDENDDNNDDVDDDDDDDNDDDNDDDDDDDDNGREENNNDKDSGDGDKNNINIEVKDNTKKETSEIKDLNNNNNSKKSKFIEQKGKNQMQVENKTEPNVTTTALPDVIKDPSNRQYFYVE